ncbi:hypothetical protein ACJIZ3_013316 [Penstemon smallii]|uniref:Pentatricopeptide repeat-containing protein n=1 Tax=Penstemon smallii TaxID=265156 RepID=A0ABD3UPH5_9LAMI
MTTMVVPLGPISSISFDICSMDQKQVLCFTVYPPRCCLLQKADKGKVYAVKRDQGQSDKPLFVSDTGEKKFVRKVGKKEHHFWNKRDSSGSGQKALNIVRVISRLPNEKEAVYGALDEWIAFETEFPLIAAAKALRILRNRNQWKQVIRVTKWMLSKGQGATMATYDCLLLAFDMDERVDEAELFWDTVLNAHNRSISKRLFSRMISLYDHHNVPNKVIEVFADMEELGVKPDEDTVRRIARAFKVLGQEDKQKQVMRKYQRKWKYIHFNGERVRARTHPRDEINSSDM